MLACFPCVEEEHRLKKTVHGYTVSFYTVTLKKGQMKLEHVPPVVGWCLHYVEDLSESLQTVPTEANMGEHCHSLSFRHNGQQRAVWLNYSVTQRKQRGNTWHCWQSIAGSIFRCQLFIKLLWSSYVGFIFTSLTNDFEYRHSVTTEMLVSEFWNKRPLFVPWIHVCALSFHSFVYYGSQHPRDTERSWCRVRFDW